MSTRTRDYYREDFEHLFDYNPDTGILTHKARTAEDFEGERAAIVALIWNARFEGEPAGTLTPQGYVMLQIDRVPWLAHRVAWALMEGLCPADKDIDHINGERADNRWANMRLASRQENQWNRKLSAANQGRTTGVYPHKGAQGTKYRAFLRSRGVLNYLGSFDTQEEAVAIREAKKVEEAQLLGLKYGPMHGK